MQKDVSSAIWSSSTREINHPQRITPPAGRYRDVSYMPDGSLLASSGNGRELNIWRFFSDGSARQITKGTAVDWNPVASADGKQIAFLSTRGGGQHVWLTDPDGRSVSQLTNDASSDFSPSFAADASIVYGAVLNGSQAVFKINPANGDRASLLAGARSPLASPASGRYLACVFADPGAREQWMVFDWVSHSVVKRFPDIPTDSWVRWSAGGRSLLFLRARKGVSNIFDQPVTDGPEQQLSHFEENMISSFDVSVDGSSLGMVRGPELSDAVLWENQP